MVLQTQSTKQGVVSIDLDEIWLYHQIHGLSPLHDSKAGPVMQKGLKRFVQIMDDLQIPATIFVVGKEIAKADNQITLLQNVTLETHEIASHSMNHLYQFHLLSFEKKREEIRLAAQEIENVTKKQVKGFRAPGYQFDSETLSLLQEMNYFYDASLLPSLPYYFARRIILQWYVLQKRNSHSHHGHIKNFLHKSHPRRISNHFWQMPIGTFPYLRIPCIGTTLAMLPKRIIQPVCRHTFSKHSYFDIEFHGIDFLDVTKDDIDPQLVSFHKELKKSIEERLELFYLALKEFKRHYEVRTIADHVSSLESSV